MKFTLSILILLFMFAALPAQALTGNEYNKLTHKERTLYLVGVVDGLMTEKLASTNKQPPLAKCLAQLEWDQIRAIFEKHLTANPEIWNFPAAFSFRTTFKKYCNVQ